MQVTLKLFATLGDHLPPGARFNQVELDVPDGTTVQALIDRYQLPPKLVHLVLVNGVFVPPAERATRALAPGDVLAIWPPIAGG
ncbi:sulfur carrier protein ThiS [Tepidimonas taiwanensis]|uniref:ThiS: thiamine biosynthesis protein ThiS n=1 Tax=Tepidimonas taiwanensis TaxID=307486 RepID=A0A554X8K2_9BURK|nr:sulfur carrier protein ThiS [Tepidimonas taiwanensis]MCX7693480.1 sulfur carrier protein ThiS [Tepidimonas taiwanensis]MDM7464190.1 sulfur carrier protein ThiS [Tepidimonas taiwanensis]TSE32150.1 thiS: thiamine biosynthesis protein ThiS [Tepidimonas taiwanensis]UBQ06053.1 sulfur carrier protein ThiS [Tepidimonas taiwanensis]